MPDGRPRSFINHHHHHHHHHQRHPRSQKQDHATHKHICADTVRVGTPLTYRPDNTAHVPITKLADALKAEIEHAIKTKVSEIMPSADTTFIYQIKQRW